MDSHLRAYAWIHAMAAKLTIHGFSAVEAAAEADAAIAQFDKRDFDGEVNEANLHIENLTGRLNSVAPIVAQFEQLHAVLGPLALPNETDVEVVERLAKLL